MCSGGASNSRCSAFGEVVDRHYQFDKNFLDGDGDFNEMSESELSRTKDAWRVGHLNAAATRISPPLYEALEEYTALKGLEDSLVSNFQSCDSQTVMCCTTHTRGTTNLSPNAQVCHANLEPAKRSAHVYHGEANYEGTSNNAYCIGYSMADSPLNARFMGNLLFDISYKQFFDEGSVRNVPGAPMCGCMEQMPVVSSAACRTVNSVGTEAYNVNSNDDGDLEITSAAGLNVEIGDCGSLASDYIQPDCVQARADFYNEQQFYVPSTAPNPFELSPPTSQVGWEIVVGQGLEYTPGVDFTNPNDDKLRLYLDNSPTKIVYRNCGTCLESHQHLYLVFVNVPDTNLMELLMNNWSQGGDDAGFEFVLNTDFYIYTTFEDASTLSGNNRFEFCNYDSNNVGFPKECGFTDAIQCQWNNYNAQKSLCGQQYYKPTTTAFYVDMTGVDVDQL